MDYEKLEGKLKAKKGCTRYWERRKEAQWHSSLLRSLKCCGPTKNVNIAREGSGVRIKHADAFLRRWISDVYLWHSGSGWATVKRLRVYSFIILGTEECPLIYVNLFEQYSTFPV